MLAVVTLFLWMVVAHGVDPSSVSAFTTYSYITNSNDNSLLQCTIKPDGNLSPCVAALSNTSLLSNPRGSLVHNGYLYVANNFNNRLTKCALSTEGVVSDCRDMGVTLLNFPRALAIVGAWAYICNGYIDEARGVDSITRCQVHATDGSFTACVASGPRMWVPFSITFRGTNLYIAQLDNDRVTKCTQQADGTLAACTSTALVRPSSVAIFQSFLYIARLDLKTVTKCVLGQDGSIGTCNDAGPVPALANGPVGVAFRDNYAYICNAPVIIKCVVQANGNMGTCIDSGATRLSGPFMSVIYETTAVVLYNASDSTKTAGSLVFTTVLASGTTTLLSLGNTSTGFVPLPEGYTLGDPGVYYEITTAATYSGDVSICLSYPAGSFSGAGTSSNNLRLLHYEANVWRDVTTIVNTGNHSVCGTVRNLSPFAIAAADGLVGTGYNDPHLLAPNGVLYDFDGTSHGNYTLFSSPQFHLTMQLSDDDGPATRFMTRIGLMFRNETFLFGVAAMKKSFHDDLDKRLGRAGGKVLAWSYWQVALELCPHQVVTISQMHTVDPWLAHGNGAPWYYLDVNVTAPGCHDSFDGALGQTYKCKYVSGEEEFNWSHAQEEEYRVPTLFTPTGAFQADAQCGWKGESG